MMADLASLTDQLADVLQQETELLDALDLAAAAALLARKRGAVAALQSAIAAGAANAPRSPEEDAALRDSVQRMTACAEANRAAIERGVALQMRVVQAIAAAVPRARATEAPVYQPNGSQLPPRPPEAYAFLSRM